MIFEQLFDKKSSTYTYILSSGKGREALIIDPVLEHTEEYLKLLNKLELKLVKVIDTHIHADHITGLNELSERTNCTKIMGDNSKSEVVDLRVIEDENVKIDNINLNARFQWRFQPLSDIFLVYTDNYYAENPLFLNLKNRSFAFKINYWINI